MNDDIIQPDPEEPDPQQMDPEILAQLQREAAKHMGQAQELARGFTVRMKNKFEKLGPADYLSILAATCCDMLAESLVMLDSHKLQRIDKSVPLFTHRLRQQIEAGFAKAEENKIVIARNEPPSRN